ncbi:SIMPL domain-containing protein [Ornithinibacillus scapharcae]|uniref:SIMPL domain-containing protein n=1 Tax=Ornithinibacillus scapharcae TaxID=1147159 RepID=UPI000225B684|nr:SIMPL domain-containing protein [Ornithinibacillus scapharcae]
MYFQPIPSQRFTYSQRQSQNKLKVFGEATILAEPNEAVVTLGVITENENLQEALATNSQTINNVIQAIRNSGIPQESFQTTDFHIDLNYDFQDGVQTFRGYRVTHLLTIRISNIEKVGEIVDIAVDNGANTVRNVQLSLANPQQHYNEALTLAIINAQEKAAAVADTLGVSIHTIPTSVKEISTIPPDQPRPFVLGVSSENISSTPIEAGQLEIVARVEADFHYQK